MAFKGEQQVRVDVLQCQARKADWCILHCLPQCLPCAGSPRIGTKDYAKEAPILEALDEGNCHLFCTCQHVSDFC